MKKVMTLFFLVVPSLLLGQLSATTSTHEMEVKDYTVRNVRPGQTAYISTFLNMGPSTAPNGAPALRMYVTDFPWAMDVPTTNEIWQSIAGDSATYGAEGRGYGSIQTLTKFTVPTNAVPGTFYQYWISLEDIWTGTPAGNITATGEFAHIRTWIHVYDDTTPRAVLMPGYNPNATPPDTAELLAGVTSPPGPPSSDPQYLAVYNAFKDKALGWLDDPVSGEKSFEVDGKVSGAQHFAVPASCCVESRSWYYDGYLALRKLSDLWEDEVVAAIGGFSLAWAADNQLLDTNRDGTTTGSPLSYFSNIRDNNCGISGHRVFTEGFLHRYRVDAEVDHRGNVLKCADSSPYANAAGRNWLGGSRETAYIMKAYAHAFEIEDTESIPRSARRIDESYRFVLAHIDAWLTGRFSITGDSDQDGTPDGEGSAGLGETQPFMVALTADAIFQSWDYFSQEQKDILDPQMVELADWLWSTFAFQFDDGAGNVYWTMPLNDESAPGTAAEDLNMIIAKFYAVMYQRTGNTVYAQHSLDLIDGWNHGGWVDRYTINGTFTHPVSGATFPTYLSSTNGKQWTQGVWGIDSLDAIVAAFP